jgi:hypothetical protein
VNVCTLHNHRQALLTVCRKNICLLHVRSKL